MVPWGAFLLLWGSCPAGRCHCSMGNVPFLWGNIPALLGSFLPHWGLLLLHGESFCHTGVVPTSLRDVFAPLEVIPAPLGSFLLHWVKGICRGGTFLPHQSPSYLTLGCSCSMRGSSLPSQDNSFSMGRGHSHLTAPFPCRLSCSRPPCHQQWSAWPAVTSGARPWFTSAPPANPTRGWNRRCSSCQSLRRGGEHGIWG